MPTARRRVQLFDVLLIAGACLLAPGAVGCASAPQAKLQPAAEPATATMGAEGEIEARLPGPEGEWKIGELEIDGARLLARDGDAPLTLRIKRSEKKLGETAIEGQDEPIVISVTYVDKKSGARGKAVFRLAAPPQAEQGTSIPVTAQW